VDSSRARAALVLLNLGLMAAIGYLVHHAVRGGAPTEIAAGPPVVAYAIDTSDRPPSVDPSLAVEFDRPLPEPDEKKKMDEPERKVDPLERRYTLLLVSEDASDPSRSTAIVAAASGQQRTVTLGETLDGAYQVVGLAVQGEGDARCALLIAEKPETATEPGDRQVLRTVRTNP
jgi:hypothetical protein